MYLFTYKAVSAGLSSTSVRDHHRLFDVAVHLQVLYKDDGDDGEDVGDDDEDGHLEMLPQGFVCCVVGQTSHKQLCPCCVPLLNWLKNKSEIILKKYIFLTISDCC